MENNHFFCTVTPNDQQRWQQVRAFLHENDLNIDQDLEQFVTILDDNMVMLACGGIAGRVLKCIAIEPSLRGQGLALQLMTELIKLAFQLNRYDLFLYTKPENGPLFRDCGFHEIATVKERVILMENSAHRLRNYCRSLEKMRRPGNRIGAIVMNANPFTLGHYYLVKKAAEECDWVHVFAVHEDKSDFPYQDRLDLIRQGVQDIKNITVHAGSDYLISQATFPTYFLKDQKIIDQCHMEIDIQLFRRYIAPALGIQYRYVGTEPFCSVTAEYNQQLKYWLSTPLLDAPAIALCEIQRQTLNHQPISAHQVRDLLAEHGPSAVKNLVPASTYSYLRRHCLGAALSVSPLPSMYGLRR
jgi:[citrate (pro-3S)-lyase] ligase